MRRLPRSFACSAVAVTLALAVAPARGQGIAPPPPIDPSAPGAPTGTGTAPPDEQATVAQLDQAENEDSGRHFELFWLDGKIGGSYINMTQLSNETLQVEKADAGGPMFDFGAGVRFVVLVMGARVRYNALSAFNMWQLNAEIGLKIPIRSFDLLFGLHGGYSFVGRLGDASLATNTNIPTEADRVKVRGFNTGLDVAFDYYVSPTFSVGAGILADVLFLNRPPVDKPQGFDQLPADQQAAINNDPLYQKSGTSAGLQLAGGLRLGLHFGL